jgi:hypothetical protein
MEEMKIEVCRKYNGPPEYIPTTCAALVPMAATKPSSAISTATTAAMLVVTQELPAKVNINDAQPTIKDGDKVKLQVVWRAFWYFTS